MGGMGGDVAKLDDRRRDHNAPVPPDSRPPNGGGGGGGGRDRGGEKVPPLWRWFGTQVHHSDSAKSAAARHVRSRWDIAVKRFSAIDRALATEDSEHLTAFRMLLDEYRVTFDIPVGDEDFARETGAAGLLIPFAPEKCDSCNRDAVPGTGKCGTHGGQWISPDDMTALSHRIHDKLLTMTEAALRVLQDLMDNGRSEQVRLMAATAVLDRAGVGPHMNVNHTGEVTITNQDAAAHALQVRLDRMATNAAEQRAIAADALAEAQSESDPVDAEVVEDTT